MKDAGNRSAVTGGKHLDGFITLLAELLAEAGCLVGLDIVEVNPILDRGNSTAKLAAELALSALGKRIF